MIRTMNAFRPWNRNFARARAARKASVSESTTTTPTTIRLLRTFCQKYWRWIASPKVASVAGIGSHLGEELKMFGPALKAVETLQYTGENITADTSRRGPRRSEPPRAVRPGPARGRRRR